MNKNQQQRQQKKKRFSVNEKKKRSKKKNAKEFKLVVRQIVEKCINAEILCIILLQLFPLYMS